MLHRSTRLVEALAGHRSRRAREGRRDVRRTMGTPEEEERDAGHVRPLSRRGGRGASAPTPAGSSPGEASTPTRWARRARTCSSTRALVRGRRGRPNLAHLTHQHQAMARDDSRALTRAAASRRSGAALSPSSRGYAAHLCLDAGAHPWVLYWTGDITDGADPPAGTAAFRRHGILEASIDVILPARSDAAWPPEQRLLACRRRRRRRPRSVVSGMQRRARRDVHAPGRELGLPRDGVGLHDDERSALPADAAAREGRPRGRQGRRRAHPDLPGDGPPTASRRYAERSPWYYPSLPDEPRTATFAEISRPRRPRRRAACGRSSPRSRRGRGRGGGRHRRPEHVHRCGVRRSAAAGGLRPRERRALGRGLSGGVSASS